MLNQQPESLPALVSDVPTVIVHQQQPSHTRDKMEDQQHSIHRCHTPCKELVAS